MSPEELTAYAAGILAPAILLLCVGAGLYVFIRAILGR